MSKAEATATLPELKAADPFTTNSAPKSKGRQTMSNSSTLSQDTALAFLLAQHTIERAEAFRNETAVKVTVSMSPDKPRVLKAKKVAAPIHDNSKNASRSLGMILPEKGSLDAAGFMQAVRQAGRRLNEAGIPYTVEAEVRHDTIKAIAGFIGYDVRQDFGTQESFARSMAQRLLRNRPVGGLTRDEQRAKARNMAGTGQVSGLPDMLAKRLANLQGQAVKATEAMLEHEKVSNDPTKSERDRVLAEGLAQVERDRLAHINRDVAALEAQVG